VRYSVRGHLGGRLQMNEDRFSPADKALIKSALRRAFSRSEAHERALAAARIEHSDPARPKCRKWVRCQGCQQPRPEWSSDVDHIDPVIPIGRAMKEMSVLEVIDRAWCEDGNLQVLCESCHGAKTKAERDARTEANRAKKPPKAKKARKKAV
jgi:5-methylcytosine-specific restriction endonuclease McrA